LSPEKRKRGGLVVKINGSVFSNNVVLVSNIIQVIKSRRMRRAGHVACLGEEVRCIYGFGVEI